MTTIYTTKTGRAIFLGKHTIPISGLYLPQDDPFLEQCVKDGLLEKTSDNDETPRPLSDKLPKDFRPMNDGKSVFTVTKVERYNLPDGFVIEKDGGTVCLDSGKPLVYDKMKNAKAEIVTMKEHDVRKFIVRVTADIRKELLTPR